MNILFIVLSLAAMLGLVALHARGFIRTPRILRLANIGEGTHCGSISKKADAAIATRNLLVKFGSDGDHVAACGANDIPLGPVDDEAEAAEDFINVRLLGVDGMTQLMVASEAITAGEAVFTAANGKVQDLPGGAGTYYQVGYALTAAGADGDVIEVQHCAPIKTVVS